MNTTPVPLTIQSIVGGFNGYIKSVTIVSKRKY